MPLTRKELIDTLLAIGIGAGDIVHIQSDLRSIGPVDAPLTREGMLDFYLSAFQEVIGPEGTVCVLTASMAYGRHGTPFVLETTPSEVGVFSEHVRTREGAIRSCHPIMSLCALGKKAETICGGPHFDAYGYDSAWARLHREGGKLVTLGIGMDRGGTSFFHYLENLYGVPYTYTKIFPYPVYAKGELVPGPFTMSLRYHDFGIVNTPIRMKTHLHTIGKARYSKLGNSAIWTANCKDVVDEGILCLRKDRYFLLKEAPKFRPGEMPMDGPTGPTQLYYDKAATKPSAP